MAFKLSLVADVRQWLKGTQDVEKSLDDIADSLDELALETKADSDKAADMLSKNFRKAFDEVKTESKQAGKKLGQDLKDGTDKAGEGFDDLKDEANQSAREAAASFSGNFEDVADYIQEVLAQALSGFGPIGAAAGLAAAAGIGILIANLQDAEEKAHEAQDRINSLASELAEVHGNPKLIDWFSRVETEIQKVADKKDWWEFWQPEDITVGQQITKLMAEYNLGAQQASDIARGRAGDVEAATRAQDFLNKALEEEWKLNVQTVDEYGNVFNSRQAQINALNDQKNALGNVSTEQREVNQQYQTFLKNEKARQEAIDAAADSDRNFADNLRNSGSVLDDFASQIVKGGKIVYSAWEKLRKQMRSDNKIIMDVDADPRLSPEAKENFRNLPREVQTAIAKEFKKGGKHDDKVIAELNADGKVNVGKITPTKPVDPINVPTKVDESQIPSQVDSASNKAQSVANREGNKIEFKTKIDSDGLQSAVNRAAASIHEPTIYVKVKTKKEVP